MLITPAGERIDASISADGQVWAVAHPDPESPDFSRTVTIHYVLTDGSETEAPRIG